MPIDTSVFELWRLRISARRSTRSASERRSRPGGQPAVTERPGVYAAVRRVAFDRAARRRLVPGLDQPEEVAGASGFR